MLLRVVPLLRPQTLRFSTVSLRQLAGIPMFTPTPKLLEGVRTDMETSLQQIIFLSGDRSLPSRLPEASIPHSLPTGFRTVFGQQILLICPIAPSVVSLDIDLPGCNAPRLDLPTTAEGEQERDFPGGPPDFLDTPGDASKVEVETPSESVKVARLCVGVRRRARKSQGLFERWWLEYDPPKANYISGKGRGPFGGNSIRKADWPRQMVPIRFKKKWEQRESIRFAFRKHGFEHDVPKWGG